MLVFSLLLSGVLAAVSLVAARPAPHSVRWGLFLATAVFLCGGPILVQVIPTAAIFTTITLGLALAAWPHVRHLVRVFFPLGAAALVVAFGVGTLFALADMAEFARLRDKCAYESMADRVPEARADARVPLSDMAERRLTELDQQVKALSVRGSHVRHLKQLHEKRVHLFATSPGFGVARMDRPRESAMRLRDFDRPPSEDGPPRQVDPQTPFSTEPEIALERPGPADPDYLDDMHAHGVLDFVNPPGFGFIKDRDHVAGRVHGRRRRAGADGRGAAER